jgi:hypothetical protein
MTRNAAAFVAGLGNGYFKADRQRQEDDRQAKLDAMQQEQFGWARDRATEEQRKREQQAAIDQAVVDAGNAGKVDENGAAVTYTNDAGQQKTAYQPDLQTAQYAAQQDALERGTPMPGSEQPNAPKAEAASSVRTLDGGRKLFTGLTAAQQAKQYSDENPVGSYAKYMALSEKLSGMAGGQEMADKYLARAKAAEKEGAFKTLNLLESGDAEGAAKAWNATGARRLQPGQSFATTTDKTGNKVHQVVNQDGSIAVPNVESALLRYISGIEGVASQAQAATKLKNDMTLKQWEFENDPTKRYRDVKPGSDLYDTKTGTTVTDNKTGYVPVLDANGNPTYDEDGVMRMVKGSAKGQGSSGGSGKVPESIKLGLDGQKDLIPTATAAYETLRNQHPNLNDGEAQAIATRFAKTGSNKTTFDPKTGLFNDYFTDKRERDKDGNFVGDATGGTYLVRSREYAKGGPIGDAEAKKAFADWKSSLPASELAGYSNIVKTPDSFKAYQTNAAQKMGELRKAAEDQFNAATTPQEKARIEALYKQKRGELEAEARKVDFFQQFNVQEKTSPSADKKLAAPGGLYQPKPGAPSDIAARAQAAEKAVANKAATDKAAADAKTADAAKRKADISWLGEAEARVMKPSEAQKYLSQYQDVLDPEVARALRRQM